MTRNHTAASFGPDVLGGVPEAFVQTALLASGIGLWEWSVTTDRMALSPYLETLFGYPSGEFEATKAAFLALLKPIDKPRFETALANAVQSSSFDAAFMRPRLHPTRTDTHSRTGCAPRSRGARVSSQPVVHASRSMRVITTDFLGATRARRWSCEIPVQP